MGKWRNYARDVNMIKEAQHNFGSQSEVLSTLGTSKGYFLGAFPITLSFLSKSSKTHNYKEVNNQ